MPKTTAPPVRACSGVRQAGGSGMRWRPRRRASGLERRGLEVHGRAAEESGDEGVGRRAVDIHRRADLHQAPLVDDADPAAHGHGLHLVVRHVDGRGAQAVVEVDELVAGADPQPGVQVGQRLVEQKDFGVPHDGAADGNPLPLPAGERVRPPVEERGQTQGRGRLLDSALDFRPWQAAPLQPEGQVVAHVHVGVEGVGLEHHGDVAVLGGDVVHDPAVDRELAGGDALQSRDHPQDGGLAAPRGAEQDHELAVLHPEADVRDGRLPGPLEELRQSIQRDHRHGLPSPAPT